MSGYMPVAARPDWNTPANVLERVRRIGPIGLDPCSNDNSIVGAQVAYLLPEADGLMLSWTHYGLAYVNPPYGRAIGAWTAKARTEAKAGAEIVALLPARTDTAWWQTHVAAADAICFWRGRITFLGAPAGAPFPSALVYWGERRKRFVEAFGDAGWIP